MLTEERYAKILTLLAEKKSITVSEVKDLLDTSESTVRRDITALNKAGKLLKVFGGAVAIEDHVMRVDEPTVEQKMLINKEEKCKIASYAAKLIKPDDFVFLDAGTTTGYVLDYLEEKNATFVTNAVAHAKRLASMGVKVFLVGGELKPVTEAVVGSQATEMLSYYHFTKGFFGTNGITRKTGFTTPDVSEAEVKKTALRQCKYKYILADHDKFDNISPVSFAKFTEATIITDRKIQGMEDCKNMLFVGK